MSQQQLAAPRRQRRQRQRADLALGDLAVVLEEPVVEPGAERQARAPRPGRDLDRRARSARRTAASPKPAAVAAPQPLLRPAERLEHVQPRRPEAVAGEQRARSAPAPSPSEVSARIRAPGCSSGRISSTGRPCSDSVSTSCSGQPSRAAARLKAEAAGTTSISAASTWRASVAADAVLERVARGEHADRAARAAPAPPPSRRRTGSARPAPRRGSAARRAPGAAGRRTPPRRPAISRRARAPSPSTPSSPMPTTASHFGFVCAATAPLDAGMADLHVLILGGTGEARVLAERLAARPRRPRDAVARRPHPRPGAAGLRGPRSAASAAPTASRAWLDAQAVDALVDATHPFARTHHRQRPRRRRRRRRAADRRRAGRPGQPVPGDRWIARPRHGRRGRARSAPRRAASSSRSAGRRSPPSAPRRSTATWCAASSRPTPPTCRPAPRPCSPAARSPRPTSARCCERAGIEVVVAKNSGGDADLRQDRRGARPRPAGRHGRPPAGAEGGDARRGAGRLDHLAALAAKRGV